MFKYKMKIDKYSSKVYFFETYHGTKTILPRRPLSHAADFTERGTSSYKSRGRVITPYRIMNGLQST